MKYCQYLFLINFSAVIGFSFNANGQQPETMVSGHHTFEVPEDYLKENDNIPSFWVTSVDGVTNFLYKTVKKGRIEVIGKSAGGRLIRSVSYGKPRQGKVLQHFPDHWDFGM